MSYFMAADGSEALPRATVAPTLGPDAGEHRIGTRILLVDDDEDIAILVHSLLANEGIDVDWASDHAAAIEAIRDDGYALLLIDYHLGATDGVRLMHEVSIRGYDAPMIMLSGSVDPSVDVAAMRAGAVNFLSKGELTGTGLSRAIRYARERHLDLSRARNFADSMQLEASTDPLTRLGNRRAFDLDLARLVDGYGAGGLLIIDLDGLKVINDTLGHLSGDIAIQAIAERTRESIRAGDSAYRIGGDEFAVITRTPGVVTFGRHLANILARVAGPDCVFRATVGWAEREPDDTPAALVQRADQVLYANKVLNRGQPAS